MSKLRDQRNKSSVGFIVIIIRWDVKRIILSTDTITRPTLNLGPTLCSGHSSRYGINLEELIHIRTADKQIASSNHLIENTAQRPHIYRGVIADVFEGIVEIISSFP